MKTKNPFPTMQGFGLRLKYACEVLRKYGLNPYNPECRSLINSRKFDNCFENFDSDAVVYAIMVKVHENNDYALERGIKAFGAWEQWNQFFLDIEKKQLPLFE